MSEPTIAAGYPKAFLYFAVSRGADRKVLLERSQIRPDDLKDQEGRIRLANYMALMRAGIELCNEPALALLFGEAATLHEMSIVELIGKSVGSVEEGHRQLNRYARLALDEGGEGTSDILEFVRENGNVWLKSTSDLYVDNPLLTESAFARNVCGMRALAATVGFKRWPYPTAIRFTHEEPSYRAEYDRIFNVPLFFGSRMNAWLMDEEFLSLRLPRPSPYLSRLLRAHAEGLLKDLERSKSTRGRRTYRSKALSR